jgi:hypothetical protein
MFILSLDLHFLSFSHFDAVFFAGSGCEYLPALEISLSFGLVYTVTSLLSSLISHRNKIRRVSNIKLFSGVLRSANRGKYEILNSDII